MSHLTDPAKLTYTKILKDYDAAMKLMNELMPENIKAPAAIYPEPIRRLKVEMIYDRMAYLRNDINMFAIIMTKNCVPKGGRKTRKNNRK